MLGWLVCHGGEQPRFVGMLVAPHERGDVFPSARISDGLKRQVHPRCQIIEGDLSSKDDRVVPWHFG